MTFGRKVRIRLLIKKTLAYRLLVTVTQILLAYIFTHDVGFSVGFSLIWNVVNTLEYFGFDYVFSKLYKVGKDNDISGGHKK
jgi:uncharacterized membrane protein